MDDIDLMVGLLLERLSDGAIVGPTSQCLIADGFYRYKAGDRFFYDVQGQPGSFTPGEYIYTFGRALRSDFLEVGWEDEANRIKYYTI